jgi:GH18 family chitinase
LLTTLQGVWDSNDPIGSIVQAHTNLTEIQEAVELLWRVEVPPEKVVLGLGFYGRSFQLSNSDCSTPGCPFSGPADAGTCTANPGTLAYFEIMDILDKQSPDVIHDKDAAVKYIQYGTHTIVNDVYALC